MSDERPGNDREPEDVGADTERFRAFVRGAGEEPQARGNRFRLLSLLFGLLLLAAIVALLLR